MKKIAACLLLLSACLMSVTESAAELPRPLVFVSSFAGGDDGAINAFELKQSKEGTTLVATERTGGIAHPFFMAISDDHNFLYAIHAEKFGGDEDEEIAAYAIITHGRGKLHLLNRQSARGTASCYLDVDSDNKMVVVANYSTGSVASFPMSSKPTDGLKEAASFFQHEGSSVNPKRQKGPNAHSIVISPDNRFAFAADLGIDQVLCYVLDPDAGTMEPNADHPSTALAPGSGPRHMTFHPDGKRLYVINELLNTVTAFDYDADSGALAELQTVSTLPDGFDGVTHTADLKITPDGKFLYGTNRGHDSIAAFRIGDDGKLTLIDIVPSLGKGPQNLAISGDVLLCANLPGNNVALFKIDFKSGAITPLGEPVEVTKPSCILVVEP